ncbi:MAG TPA: hypothetical protein VGB30_00185 [bacterium]|jgi:hypothetical protein
MSGSLSYRGLYYPAQFIDNIVVQDNLLLVSCGSDGVICYDLETVAGTLPELFRLDTEGHVRRAKIRGNFLFIADMDGVAIYKLSALLENIQ